MIEFFYKILVSENFFNKMDILGFFWKKNQIWFKNPQISFRQFKLTLAEGGYIFFFFKKTKYLGSNKNMNVALFCIVVQSKPYLWHWKMYFTLILTLFRVDFFGAANGWATKRGQKCPPLPKTVTHILQWWDLAQL